MSVEVWQPTKVNQLTETKLDQYVGMVNSLDLDNLSGSLPELNQKSDSWLMKLDLTAWEIASRLDTEQIIALIRFFTLAEMQLAGWDAGKTSPVIALVKLLKKRGEFASELKQWIKSNTDNRYLPNGAVLM